jgi:hypothetical protein
MQSINWYVIIGCRLNVHDVAMAKHGYMSRVDLSQGRDSCASFRALILEITTTVSGRLLFNRYITSMILRNDLISGSGVIQMLE